MITLPDTVREYSEYAAKEFVQTVVFIDDQIYERAGRYVARPIKISRPKQRKKVTRSAQARDTVSAVEDNIPEIEEYSPHDIVTSFAKKSIICSLYQPDKRARYSATSDVFSLCLSADVIIVDWDLFGDGGKRAIELIDGLIKQAISDIPEQLRLILIYTQEVNLFSVADQLYQSVNEGEDFPLEPIKGEGGLSFGAKK